MCPSLDTCHLVRKSMHTLQSTTWTGLEPRSFWLWGNWDNHCNPWGLQHKTTISFPPRLQVWNRSNSARKEHLKGNLHALLASGLRPGLGSLRLDRSGKRASLSLAILHRGGSPNRKEFSDNFIILIVKVSQIMRSIAFRTNSILNIYFCETERQCVLALKGQWLSKIPAGVNTHSSWSLRDHTSC